MTRHEFLRALHRLARPRTYLEIGVGTGKSLALSCTRSLAVDPDPRVAVPLGPDVGIVTATSDEFFAREDPLGPLLLGPQNRQEAPRGTTFLEAEPGPSGLDLVFIDGMHLVEFALRDLMNVERHAEWWTVIVLDDVFPRSVDEAARDRHTQAWAGDVYKLIPILARYRPDLHLVPVDTTPTGLLLVLGADRGSRVLTDHYGGIVAEWVGPDPQPVPGEVLARRGALAPDAVLGSEVWRLIEAARGGRIARAEGMGAIRAALPAAGLEAIPAPDPPSKGGRPDQTGLVR